MPELPEVEHLRRTLIPALDGARVESARLHRPDVLRTPLPNGGFARWNSARGAGARLLSGQVIRTIQRRGKQLAIMTDGGPVLSVHLGMSGQVMLAESGRRFDVSDHVHAMWRLSGPQGCFRMAFRDPRRFGGLWAFDAPDDLYAVRWASLGPDALTIRADTLASRLARSRRAIKATLFDQSVIAGLGNIYIDECLFRAGIHPLSPTHSLEPHVIRTLAASIRTTLRQALHSGGSTIATYRDPTGRPGKFTNKHAVYGRARESCVKCGTTLVGMVIAQRTTVMCPMCQPRAVCSPANAITRMV